MLERIKATIQRHGMLSHGHRIGVAVSGGGDSVFLLRALQELGFAAAVLHVNHKLRGAESDADEAFVRDLAAEAGLPFHLAVRPPGEGNIEQEARRARYRFFNDRMALGLCDSVATGHTLDDQAETVVSRFLRGAGTAGLSGVLPVTVAGIVRPLIELQRMEIRGYLESHGIAWREDRSNADTNLLRNRIRLEIMPELLKLNPSLPQVLASTAEWARGEEGYWMEGMGQMEREHLLPDPPAIMIRVGGLTELPLAVQRRLLRHAIGRVRGNLRSIGFVHVEAIRNLTTTREGSGRVQIPDIDAFRSFDWLRISPLGYDSRLARNFETPLEIPGHVTIPERRLDLRTELIGAKSVYNSDLHTLDRDRCPGQLMLRNWRPGDHYTPVNGAEEGKVKTLFQDHRIPLWDRRGWPVIVASDGSIAWVREFGVASQYAAGPESRQVLIIHDNQGNRTGAAGRLLE